MAESRIPTFVEKLTSMATEARLRNEFIEVSEIRYTVCGIPSIITDQYVYFEEAWEVESTGKLGSKPKAEKCFHGKLIAVQAITTCGFIPKP